MDSRDPRSVPRRWTFLTNHAHALLCLAQDPHMRVRDLATRIDITERAAQRIIADLEAAGFVVRHRNGRRSSYELRLELPMRHPVEQHRPVSALVRALRPGRDSG